MRYSKLSDKLHRFRYNSTDREPGPNVFTEMEFHNTDNNHRPLVWFGRVRCARSEQRLPNQQER